MAGFPSGKAYEETETLEIIRNAAFAIRGLEVPPVPQPEPPVLLPISDVSMVSWRGSPGAEEYDVLRSENPQGPWKVVGPSVSDAALPYAPLFHDDSAELGKKYYYSVVARNKSGVSAPSNIVGPIEVVQLCLVDNCLDTSKVVRIDGDEEFATGDDRKTREDSHRLKLAQGSSLTYQVDLPIASWFVEAYFADDQAALEVSASADGKDFQPCQFVTEELSKAKNDYNYLRYAVLRGDSLPADAKYLRIKFPTQKNADSAAQVGRLQIFYGRLAD